MQDSIFFVSLWVVCGIATIVAGLLATRSRRWMYVGRGAVGVLFLIGGALLHAINIATDGDYTDFADPAHFGWVTDAWRAVVPPNQDLLIGLLALFEATVGVLILSGKRRTQLGYAGVIAFYVALWMFGWFETIWVILMLPPTALLLRAERRAEASAEPESPADIERKPLANVGS
jgi:hypothetical protein